MNTTTQQTLQQYLETLPGLHKKRAIENVVAQLGKDALNELGDWGLDVAFDWITSPEGTGYWALVHKGRYADAEALLFSNNEKKIIKPTDKKRYVVTVSFFMYAEDDKAIMREASNYTSQLNKEQDCRATVECITQSQYGKLGTRKVF